MGIGFVLSFWFVVGSIAAAIGALALRGITSFLTRNVDGGKNRAAIGAFWFPPACFLWVVLVFVFQSAINIGVLHRDCGLGDGFWCPLPNGYELAATDTLNAATIFKLHEGSIGDAGINQKDAISGVTQLQTSDQYFLGCIGGTKGVPEALKECVQPQKEEFFLLDCKTGENTKLSTYKELCQTASKLGIKPALQSVESLYDQNRLTIFDFFLIPLILLPMIAAFVLLVRQIIRYRRGPSFTSTPPTVP